MAVHLMEYSQSLGGMDAYCIRAYAEAMEVIPSTLAENAGLNPIAVVTELRKRHANGEKSTGVNVRKVKSTFELLAICDSKILLADAGDNYRYFRGERGTTIAGFNVCHSIGYRDR